MEVRYMPLPEIIIKEIDMLSEEDRKKVLDKIKEKYMAKDVLLLGGNSSWLAL
ncbi:hypothetical protein QNH47_10260 [Virgibacillus halodenitrificans]|uniref:hypothetical protein n=1 Tax=Virgibacillus halodenitrificans TaxID=1482 RepID=UPI0024BF9BAC|nr:hypothetical protein [Virgibacillus halodenitrificans]WHX24580.1 hypothetical protein QNH47_10260 [Virgibacillus halodenitrificans]